MLGDLFEFVLVLVDFAVFTLEYKIEVIQKNSK